MKFAGKNEIILAPETVRVLVEDWMNSKRIVDLLELVSVTQLRGGRLKVIFQPRVKQAKQP